MNYVANVVRRISSVAAIIAGVCLISLMVLTVANASIRSLGGVIPGTHEMSQCIIVVAVAGAFAYATLEGAHIVIRIVLERLAQLPRRILWIITSVISLGVVVFMAWANVELLSTRWLGEYSPVLKIPSLPFRFAFVVGLIFFGLVLLIDIYKGLSEVMRK